MATPSPRPEPSLQDPRDHQTRADADFDDLRRSLGAVAIDTLAEVACDGLGITVHLGDDLVFGHGNAFTRAVDRVQYGLMQGPCLLAHTTGAQVRSTQIGAGEQRWPRFTPRAAQAGVRSVVSAPLFAADRVIGSLNLYGTTVDQLSRLRPDTVTLVAEKVEQELRSPVLLAVIEANTRWFTRAVDERAEVDRAVGVLMDRYGLDVVEAQVLVQQLAYEDGVSELVAARTVILQDGP